MHKLALYLKDSLSVDGSIIDFRIYDGEKYSTLVTASNDTNKLVYGLDTFSGLDHPNIHDLNNPDASAIKRGAFKIPNTFKTDNPRCIIKQTKNYNDLDELLPKDEKFCFALIDLKQFTPTQKVLNFLWDKMSYGGTLYFSNYDPNAKHSDSYAITDFIANHLDNINLSRQMLVDGKKETFLVVKCFNGLTKPVIKEPNESVDKVTIALVLKTGGLVYNHNYVNALAKGIKQNVTVDHEVVCLTDDATGISDIYVDRVIPLTNNYPTWWSKIELFKSNQFSTKRVFYLDLDTVIVGNIDELVSYNGNFAGLRDFYGLHTLGSGLMAWHVDKVEQIYTKFAPIAEDIMTKYRREGDQKWIDENKPSIDYFQDNYLNQVVSYKRHCLKADNKVQIPSTAKIICFHGNPRPHTITDPAIIPYWQP